MQIQIGWCLFLIFGLLLTGCTDTVNQKSSANATITIEPYNMSKKEKLLVSKTGVEQIEFFKLDGKLQENDDLQFAVEVYENGKIKEELLSTYGEPTTMFEDSIISFGIKYTNNENHSLELLAGIPTGFAATNFSNNKTMSSFVKLVGKKVILEKNKPVYLAMWVGTTKNELSTFGGEKGELPANIEEVETALLYRVIWTDSEKK